MTAKEIFIETLQDITTIKGLENLENNVCKKWCNYGVYCDPDRCAFAKALANRKQLVVLLEEQRAIIEKRAQTKRKDQIIKTKHRSETNIMMGSIIRSITCTRKRENDVKRIAALDKAMAYAKKYNKQGIRLIAEKYNFEKLLIVIKNNTKKYTKEK